MWRRQTDTCIAAFVRRCHLVQRPAPSGGGSSLVAALRDKEALASILTAGAPVATGPTGHGGRHRVVNNMHCVERPWEASCIEVRHTKAFDTAKELEQHVSLRGRVRKLDLSPPAGTPAPAGVCKKEDDGVEIIMYFETSNDEGLNGYRTIADKVLRGELPGECRNTTGQYGYATWSIPRPAFVKLAAPLLRTPPPRSAIIRPTQVALDGCIAP